MSLQMDAIMLVTHNATYLYPLLLPSVMNCVLIIRFVTSKQLNITLLKHMHVDRSTTNELD